MWREAGGVPGDTPDLCLGLLGVTVGMMRVRFEGEDVELGGNLLRVRGLWGVVRGVHRALVLATLLPFRSCAWPRTCVSSALEFEEENTGAQRDYVTT